MTGRKIETGDQTVITTWYVDTQGDSHTNEVIAQALTTKGIQSPDQDDIMCTDGKRRSLWRVPDYGFIRWLKQSKREAQLTFTEYYSYNDGKPTEYKLGKRKDSRLGKTKRNREILKRKER